MGLFLLLFHPLECPTPGFTLLRQEEGLLNFKSTSTPSTTSQESTAALAHPKAEHSTLATSDRPTEPQGLDYTSDFPAREHWSW